jgi:hypothetical protein
VGYAPGAWWDRRIVSADYDATTRRATNVLCDNGAGGTIACAQAPRVFLGNSVPMQEGSFSAGLTMFKNLRVNAFVDWRGGYQKLDGNYRVRCGAFVLCRELYYPDEVQDRAQLAAVQAGTAFTHHLIHDASFARFRELSATYAVEWAPLRRVFKEGVDLTLSGRNLAVWTKYSGYDPEINLFGTNAGGVGSGQTTAADRGFDFGGYPIPRTWSLSARFTY